MSIRGHDRIQSFAFDVGVGDVDIHQLVAGRTDGRSTLVTHVSVGDIAMGQSWTVVVGDQGHGTVVQCRSTVGQVQFLQLRSGWRELQGQREGEGTEHGEWVVGIVGEARVLMVVMIVVDRGYRCCWNEGGQTAGLQSFGVGQGEATHIDQRRQGRDIGNGWCMNGQFNQTDRTFQSNVDQGVVVHRPVGCVKENFPPAIEMIEKTGWTGGKGMVPGTGYLSTVAPEHGFLRGRHGWLFCLLHFCPSKLKIQVVNF